MRRLNHLQRVLSICIVIVLVLGCVMMGFRQNALSDLGYSGWTYIQYGLFKYPLKSLGNVFYDVSNLWHQYDDNQYLNQELAQQKSYKTLYDNERNENKELQKLLDMKNSLKDANMISCRVVNRSSNSWDQTVVISAGTNQGVKENMLVITQEGAVGIIKECQKTTSTVQLLTSNDLVNNIAVKMSLDDGASFEGVIESYDVSRHEYKMALFDNGANVTPGQAVSTSGKGGNYPSGIYIGTVTDVELNDDSIISTVYVRPVSDMRSFNYVIVLGSGVVSE